MPSRLTKLAIDEISVVESGANQRAQVLLVKGDTDITLWGLGRALAHLRQSDRQPIAKADDAPVAVELVTPSISLIRAGYAQVVAKALAADHTAYDEQYGLQTDPQAWATPHEEDES